ncbi:MAG: helicase-related protein [Rhodospirillales bacterium]
MAGRDLRPRVSAVLGPTNTGKTYLAIERMAGHASGMMGFPLRLLARENYDKVVRLKGPREVALITGEERITPPHARYFLCTTESMPLDRPVDFLALDEVQMCADPERGHIFTDRLLHARGQVETMLLGADTMRPVIRALVPEAEFIARPRLSKLTYAGPRKLTRLPKRSAVVAFSINDVYQIAELVRRQRGGTAVVLGALSPRTRNAQVAMYQAGEVDFMVATDAIGMGLNMSIDHVTFSALTKFDGRRRRRLTPSEIAQIAGRAGRHLSDGTFGPSLELGPMDPAVVDAVEGHRFDPLPAVFWRNDDLDFSSPRALLGSLDAPPPHAALMRARPADDQLSLVHLSREPAVAERARSRARMRLLWDVCQVPDFRKTMPEAHTRLQARIFDHLTGPQERLPTDWVADQLARLDRTDGDIDTLMARIAHVRTWTYVSHRNDWLADAGHWQERARAIEDRLSDALHDRLTQRFVDRRAAVLSRIKEMDAPFAAVTETNAVVVEGEAMGRLEGFRFVPDPVATGENRRALLAAGHRALRAEIARRVERLAAADDAAIAADETARLSWQDAPIARLRPGRSALEPRIEALPSELLTPTLRSHVEERLAGWLDRRQREALGPLTRLRAAEELTGAARGIAFQLVEAMGSLPRRTARAQVAALSADERRQLTRLGVRIGLESVYIPALLKPRAAALRALLWSVRHDRPPLAPPPAGAVTVAAAPDVPAAFYEAVGFRLVGGRAVRLDILERLAARLLRLARQAPFTPGPELASLTGLPARELNALIAALGYRAVDGGGFEGARRRERKPAPAGKRPRGDADSPFAKLKALALR